MKQTVLFLVSLFVITAIHAQTLQVSTRRVAHVQPFGGRSAEGLRDFQRPRVTREAASVAADCQSVGEQMKAHRARVMAHDEQMTGYFRALAERLDRLYEQYSPVEGKTVDVPSGLFDPVGEAAVEPLDFAERIYDASQAFDQELVQIRQLVRTCLENKLPTQRREALLVALESHNMNARDTEAIVASTMELFGGRLTEWHESWARWEGSERTFEPRFFEPLRATRTEAQEAARLVHDLGSTFAAHLSQLIEQIQEALTGTQPLG